MGRGEEVQDVCRVGDVRRVGLELAAGGAVRVGALGVVLADGKLVEPVVEEAEPVLPGVQAAPYGASGLLLQGHHELVIHGTVDAVIDGGRQAWASGVG